MKNRKPKIVIIHGGTTFKNRNDYHDFLKKRPISLEKRKSWKGDLEKKMCTHADIIQPRMPNGDNAKYVDWKIHFDRIVALLDSSVILVGVSLGGVFLAKYLSENKFPKKIIATYLVGPPFDNTTVGEDLVGGFTLQKDLGFIMKNSPKTTLLFSANDTLVPLSHAQKYMKKLPEARVIVYEDKNGHFFIEEFPEMVKMLKQDIKELTKK